MAGGWGVTQEFIGITIRVMSNNMNAAARLLFTCYLLTTFSSDVSSFTFSSLTAIARPR